MIVTRCKNLIYLISLLVLTSISFAVPYTKEQDLAGEMVSVGSDTLKELMEDWSKDFKTFYPGVTFEIEAKGSTTAPLALLEGRAHIGPMSRKMNEKEEDAFETKYGYKALPIRVAIDAIEVFVNKANAIKGLSIDDLDAIFSKTHSCSGKASITNWKDLGWVDTEINVLSRNNLSGTYAYFKDKALCKGEFKDSVNFMDSSEAIIAAIVKDNNAIGYSGLGYKNANIKAIPIAKKAGEGFIEPTADNVAKGKYPLGRYLYIYVNKAPNTKLDNKTKEFLKYVLSQQGQAIVQKHGFMPLSEDAIMKDLNLLN